MRSAVLSGLAICLCTFSLAAGAEAEEYNVLGLAEYCQGEGLVTQDIVTKQEGLAADWSYGETDLEKEQAREAGRKGLFYDRGETPPFSGLGGTLKERCERLSGYVLHSYETKQAMDEINKNIEVPPGPKPGCPRVAKVVADIKKCF